MKRIAIVLLLSVLFPVQGVWAKPGDPDPVPVSLPSPDQALHEIPVYLIRFANSQNPAAPLAKAAVDDFAVSEAGVYSFDFPNKAYVTVLEREGKLLLVLNNRYVQSNPYVRLTVFVYGVKHARLMKEGVPCNDRFAAALTAMADFWEQGHNGKLKDNPDEVEVGLNSLVNLKREGNFNKDSEMITSICT